MNNIIANLTPSPYKCLTSHVAFSPASIITNTLVVHKHLAKHLPIAHTITPSALSHLDHRASSASPHLTLSSPSSITQASPSSIITILGQVVLSYCYFFTFTYFILFCFCVNMNSLVNYCDFIFNMSE